MAMVLGAFKAEHTVTIRCARVDRLLNAKIVRGFSFGLDDTSLVGRPPSDLFLGLYKVTERGGGQLGGYTGVTRGSLGEKLVLTTVSMNATKEMITDYRDIV